MTSFEAVPSLQPKRQSRRPIRLQESRHVAHQGPTEIREPRRPAVIHTNERVVIQPNILRESQEAQQREQEERERIQNGARYQELEHMETTSREQLQVAGRLWQDFEIRLRSGTMTEPEFDHYRNGLADLRNYFMKLQAYLFSFPQGPRHTALTEEVYASMISIENRINAADEEFYRQGLARRRAIINAHGGEFQEIPFRAPPKKSLVSLSPEIAKWTTPLPIEKKRTGFFKKIASLFGR